jgi:hypothetical protein
VEPIAAKSEGTIWLAGTPNPHNPNNYFYKLINDAKKHFDSMASWVIPALGADVIDEKLVIGVSPMTRYANPGAPFRSVAQMQAKYDRAQRKRKWQIEYLCKFLSDEGGQFENIENVCTILPHQVGPGKWFKQGYEAIEKRNGGWFQIGIDVAMMNDFTVICVIDRNTNEQVYMHRFCPGNMGEWDKVYQAIIDVMKLFPGPCYVDCTKDRSLETEMPRRGCNIIPVIFNQHNKAPILDHLSMLIATNKIKLFKEDTLMYELGNMYRKQMAGYVRIEAAKGQHDDVPVALGLMCKDIRPMGEVAALESNVEHLLALPRTSLWRDELW